METTRSAPGEAAGALVALGFAGAAAVLFAVGDAVGFTSERAEAVFTASWVLAVLCLACAVVVAALSVVQLVVRWAGSQRPGLLEALVLVIATGLIGAVALLHPLWGTGSGAA
ncbi:hypothetical protein GTR02_09045 [Kineococcus sp. R8]|uniref:hypothetical protein n=1 Tax=Kineococcus siccus TaxID=2696567 RepID=UPI0014136BCA|nr:hypothetical protein [Kineococcus siccus]NAZ81964.1 hypothetical protein [Kineococcus siccus]